MNNIDIETSNKLKRIANKIRLNIAEIAFRHRIHIGPSFSIVEILVYLYYVRMGYLNSNITRDRFILSKGHGAFALYSLFVELGLITKEVFFDYGNRGNYLTVHPNRNIPGIEIGTGSLGHGLAIGAGAALSNKIDKTNSKTIVLMGDGEVAEGSIWETVFFAKHFSLSNLIAIIDQNGLQQSGKTKEILNLSPLEDKFTCFGWNVIRSNGHDFNDLHNALEQAYKLETAPTIIIADTIKGKGISFMENNVDWHMGQIEESYKEKVYCELLENGE